MPDNAAPEIRVGKRLLRAVEKLVGQDNVARFIFCLERTHGADADEPRDAKLFHRPNVGTMIELGGQNAMTTAMPGQEHDLAPRHYSSKQLIGRRPKRGTDLE